MSRTIPLRPVGLYPIPPPAGDKSWGGIKAAGGIIGAAAKRLGTIGHQSRGFAFVTKL